MPSTLKSVDPVSFPIVVVETVSTPSEHVKPPPAQFKWKFSSANTREREKEPHYRKFPHHKRHHPARDIYKFQGPPHAATPAGRVFVRGKICIETFPNCMIAKPPCPRGPRERKTETITSRGGNLCTRR